MDEAVIEDVDEGGLPQGKTPLKNQDLTSVSMLVGEILSEYGWHLLLATALVYLLIHYLNQRRTRRSSSAPQTSYTQQDADLIVRQQEAMEAARRKMQEELNAKAAVYREKQRLQEEEKRKQKIESWESMQQGKSYKGHRLSQSSEEATTSTAVLKPKTDKKPLRSADYNPLTGDSGGSCSWRPGRRGPSSGG